MSLSDHVVAFARSGDAQQLRSALKGDHSQACVRKALKAAAQNGHKECLKILMETSDQGGINRGLCEAAKYGQEECIKILLKKAKPLYDNSRALNNAAGAGHLSCLSYMIEQCYSKHPKSIAGALVYASQHNQEACVDMLLCHAKTDLGSAASVAADNGYISILKKLLVHCASSDHLSRGLVGAVLWGHRECAKLLIGACDAHYFRSRALAVAFDNTDWELFDLLAPLSDIGQAQIWIPQEKLDAWETAVARRQQMVLNDCVGAEYRSGRGRKI